MGVGLLRGTCHFSFRRAAVEPFMLHPVLEYEGAFDYFPAGIPLQLLFLGRGAAAAGEGGIGRLPRGVIGSMGSRVAHLMHADSSMRI